MLFPPPLNAPVMLDSVLTDPNGELDVCANSPRFRNHAEIHQNTT